MIAIINGKIMTPAGMVTDKILLIDGDRIGGLAETLGGTEAVVDANGGIIMPGMIDVHSDKIEHYIQPRPTSQMDFEFALRICERDLLSAGITTMYHSLSLFRDEIFGKCLMKTADNVYRIAELINRMSQRSHLIRHRLHLRLELDNHEAFGIARKMIQNGEVHLISFMDHTPGQGQYSDLAVYHDTIKKYNGKEISALGFEGIMEYHQKKSVVTVEELKELTLFAHQHGIAVASHDDDTGQKLALNHDIGVDISEFPISLATAREAKAQGFYTVVGAANILRGSSHSGNMSAEAAVMEDCADIICSDYYPAALLASVFHMHSQHDRPLHEMVNRVTLNPARALKCEQDYGSIETGKKADLLIVESEGGAPMITNVLIDGKPTLWVGYRHE